MKLEVGMYVRTNDGYINKIKKVNQYNVLVDARDLFGEELNIPNNEIIKASHNIIDLIEVGDYVNGWRVNRVEKEEEGTLLTVGTITSFVSRSETEPYLTQDYNEADKMCKLKSIVTKEQFSQMEYKVGD